MSEGVSEERKKILRAMGADLKFTPAHLGTDGAIEFVYNLIREEPDKYRLAVHLRQELKEMGIELIDTKDGPLWRRAKM
jgi:cysteinyl-tRNA synthetase